MATVLGAVQGERPWQLPRNIVLEYYRANLGTASSATRTASPVHPDCTPAASLDTAPAAEGTEEPNTVFRVLKTAERGADCSTDSITKGYHKGIRRTAQKIGRQHLL